MITPATRGPDIAPKIQAAPLTTAGRVAEVLRVSPAALFVDIDGTLSPTVASPYEARVGPECGAALRRLSAHLAAVCVLTGRPADEAWRLVGVSEAIYLGNHGIETWYQGELLRPAGIERFHARLARAQSMLRHALSNVPGLIFEDKGIGFAIHYGRAPSVGDDVIAAARSVARRRGLQVIPRTDHVEVRAPVKGDKGTALQKLATTRRLRSLVVIGDDSVDIPAFEAARAYALASGATALRIGVGRRLHDLAPVDLWVADTDAVCALLSDAADELSG